MLQLGLIGGNRSFQGVLGAHEGTRDREQQYQIEDRGEVEQKGREKADGYQSDRKIAEREKSSPAPPALRAPTG